MSASLAIAEEGEPALEAAGLLAPAKINLALHVTGRRSDGYHTLSSLVAFAELGDRLSLRRSPRDEIETLGPFARALEGSLPPGTPNILLRALELARGLARRHGIDLPPVTVTLEKNLPVASGIGGGSADAAALLGHFGSVFPALEAALAEASVALGADVPMCLDGRPARIAGIGEIVEPVADFPAIDAVLVNPGAPVATPLVFSRLASRVNPPMPDLPRLGDRSTLFEFLHATRNDLEAAAMSIAPVIGEACQALRQAGALFARMSGSGATVFGLFADAPSAVQAGRTIAGARPDWWVVPTRLGEPGYPNP